MKEVAAMQFLCRDGAQPNVLGCWDLFKDSKYIYLVMPFCSSGELFGYVERNGRFEEPVAKFWFRQLLNVSQCSAFSVGTFEGSLSNTKLWGILFRLTTIDAIRPCFIYKSTGYAIEIYPLRMCW